MVYSYCFRTLSLLSYTRTFYCTKWNEVLYYFWRFSMACHFHLYFLVLFLYDSIIYSVKTCRICATPILFLRFNLNFNVSNDFPWMRTDDTIFNLKFESANIMIDTTLTHFGYFLKMVLQKTTKMLHLSEMGKIKASM